MIFFQEIHEVRLIPMELLLEAPDEHLLPESKAISIDSVVPAPCEVIHESAKSSFVKILRGSYACDGLQSITIFLLGKAEFLYDDMDDGQLFLIEGHASVLLCIISVGMGEEIIYLQDLTRHGKGVNCIALFTVFNEKTPHDLCYSEKMPIFLIMLSTLDENT
jgi:hypothetical protein